MTEVERLTPEQLALWDEVGMDRPILPTAHQTREQAVNFAVADFRYVCGFDGVDVPSEAAVRAELAFRYVRVLDSPKATECETEVSQEARERLPEGWDLERFGCPQIYTMHFHAGGRDCA